MRVRPEAGGIICPQAPSKDTSGIGFAVPGNGADVPRRGAGHFRWDLEPDDLRDTGARNDQPPVGQRNQQAVNLGNALSHGVFSRFNPARRRTSGCQ